LLPIGPGNTVLNTSTNPFAVPDPMVFRTQDADTNITDTPGDKGGYFVFGFGDLAAGESTSFDTYIGADFTVDGLLNALSSVGVEAFSYTTGSDRGSDGHFAPAFGYGFVGLGLPPVVIGTPEPGSIAMLLIGLALLTGLEVYRRKREQRT
jgi:type IV pilus assembly protein PilY1